MYSFRARLSVIVADSLFAGHFNSDRQILIPCVNAIKIDIRSYADKLLTQDVSGQTFDTWRNRKPVKSYVNRLKKNHGSFKEKEKFPSQHREYDEDFAKVTTFESQMESLSSKGFRRPYVPYSPPEEMERRFFEACSRVLPPETLPNNTDLSTIKLDKPLEGRVKAKLLNAIAKELDGHFIPNSMLHEMVSLDKVLHFYSVEISQESSYDRLEAMSKKGELPPNLYIQKEHVRFDPEAAEEAGEEQDVARITAYPRSSTIVVHPENRKKHKDIIAKHQPWFNAEDEMGRGDNSIKGV